VTDSSTDSPPFFRHHVFMCTNLRKDGSQCCAQCNAKASRDFLKGRTKELGLTGKGGVRINTAGCLDRCTEGPVAVVYPEGVWYTYVDSEDLEEILQEHLIAGRPVQRLRLPD
jgi:(2Fe-2S) ferredoxin